MKYEDILSICNEMKGEQLAIETSDYYLTIIENMVNELQQLREKLKSIEWVRQYNGSQWFECPACEKLKHNKEHAGDCWLNQTITKGNL